MTKEEELSEAIKTLRGLVPKFAGYQGRILSALEQLNQIPR